MGIDHQTSESVVCSSSAGLTDSRSEENDRESGSDSVGYTDTLQTSQMSPLDTSFQSKRKIASILRVYQEEHKWDRHPQIRRKTTDILVTVFIINWDRMSERTQLFLRWTLLKTEAWGKNGANYSWLPAHKGMWNFTTLSDTSLIRFCCTTGQHRSLGASCKLVLLPSSSIAQFRLW